jgi:hypothetical protein
MCLSNRTVSPLPVRHLLAVQKCELTFFSTDPAEFKARFQKIADALGNEMEVSVWIVSESDDSFVINFSTEGSSPHAAIGAFVKRMEAV